MHNELFTIGQFTVYGYGLMTAIGIVAAYFLMEYLAKKRGLDKERVFWIIIWCLVFGYIGSKILYLITILPSIIADPSLIFRSLRDGWVMYGGLLGGILGGHLYCRYKKINAWAYFDIGLAGVALAQGFGRIGCFLAGCCYGAQTDSSFCIVFKNSEFAPNNVPLIPTQLIMSAGDFLLFAFLLLYLHRKKRDGVVTGAYLTLYSLGRFAVEFFRGDVLRGSVGPLSTSQFIAIFVAVFGIIVWILRARSKEPLYVYEPVKEDTDAADVEESSEESIAEPSENEGGVPVSAPEEDFAEDITDAAAESTAEESEIHAEENSEEVVKNAAEEELPAEKQDL
ncbi:MAG: prolipoprotein diacylglyceryl transferase [Lachnospiraceae bacterium]|nr:prolipoprotein diacylglyceryl transferase [Lachnospiraceae bacterium]